MQEYCAGKRKATIEVYLSNNSKELVVVSPCPAKVTCSEEFIIYNHKMNAPINKTFSNLVTGIEIISTKSWEIAKPDNPDFPGDSRFRTCPLPTIDGNRIYSYFDENPDKNGVSFYTDNSGTCSYKVFFNKQPLTIKDGNDNIVYSNPLAKCAIEVACDEECPEGFIKCKTTKYPGYYCMPCGEIKAELIAARLAIRRLRNG